MKYKASQRQAVRCVDRNLQIIACAGSGKTQVISARIIEILKQLSNAGVSPANIVAFTFTQKAAAELKNRIHDLYVDAFSSTRGLAEMFVDTIHAYCLNLLQAPPVYKSLKYTLLNDIRQRLLIDRYSNRSGLSQVPLLEGGLLRRWIDSRLYQQIMTIVEEGDVRRNLLPPAIVAAFEKYRACLTIRGAWATALSWPRP